MAKGKTESFMVLWKDEDGLPRAWATGKDLDKVRERARKELKAYKKKKRECNDYRQANADFVEETKCLDAKGKVIKAGKPN